MTKGLFKLQNTKTMKTEYPPWSKAELKTYILLLCAKADEVVARQELELIKSKTEATTFKKMYEEFCKDNEDQCLEKIRDTLQDHEFSYWELSQMRKEIEEVFAADQKVVMKERILGRILDNILY